jgi:hypothetical protein
MCGWVCRSGIFLEVEVCGWVGASCQFGRWQCAPLPCALLLHLSKVPPFVIQAYPLESRLNVVLRGCYELFSVIARCAAVMWCHCLVFPMDLHPFLV